MRSFSILCLAVLLAPLALGAGTAARGTEPIAIVAAENFYGELAREIGGDKVAVTSILSNPDADPHLFETSPSVARAVSAAAIVIYNGADYDPWLPKLLAAAPRAERTAIVAAELVGYRSGNNPHLWYDPPTLPAVARALAAELAKRDPADAQIFGANLAAFDASLAPVTAAIARLKAAHAGTPVTATEPVFGYMAAALGFTMLNPEFQLATMNDTEPSPSQVAGFEASLKSGQAKLLFYNSQVTDDTTTRLRQLAEDSHVPVVGVTETAPAGKTIAAWFMAELDAVAEALK